MRYSVVCVHVCLPAQRKRWHIRPEGTSLLESLSPLPFFPFLPSHAPHTPNLPPPDAPHPAHRGGQRPNRVGHRAEAFVQSSAPPAL